jgi:hypothetical protein
LADRRPIRNSRIRSPINPRFNYTTTLGRHSLKAGYEYLAVNTDVQDTNPLMGLDTYASQFSRPHRCRAETRSYNLTDFYFGATFAIRVRQSVGGRNAAPFAIRLPAGRFQSEQTG